MPDAYNYITLMCRLKAAQARNKELEAAIADAHKETIRVRNYWFQVLEDMLLEFEAMQKKAAQELQEMEKRALFAENKEMMHGTR